MLLDYLDDEVMAQRKKKFLSLTNRDGLLFMRERGYQHVQGMLRAGKLDCLGEAALARARRASSELEPRRGG